MPDLFKKTQISEPVVYVQKVDSSPDQEIPNTNAAIITQVHDEDTVDLVVFHSNGSYHLQKVRKGSSQERGTWYFVRLKDGANG
jgi:hypothetical protein